MEVLWLTCGAPSRAGAGNMSFEGWGNMYVKPCESVLQLLHPHYTATVPCPLHSGHEHKRVWLCSSKTLFTRAGSRPAPGRGPCPCPWWCQRLSSELGSAEKSPQVFREGWDGEELGEELLVHKLNEQDWGFL